MCPRMYMQYDPYMPRRTFTWFGTDVGTTYMTATRGKIELFQPVSNPFEPEFVDTSCCFRAHFVHISDECIEISIKYSIDLVPWTPNTM